MAQYGKLEYWNERYTHDRQAFEWFQRYSALKPHIEAVIPKESKILYIGCGTSRLAEDMVDDGYQDIKCTDGSNVAIQIVQKRAEGKTGLSFECQNVLDLVDSEEGQFDAVIDKGCMDAILCGDGSYANVQRMLQGISRVLKAGGVFFEVSYGTQQNRSPYLQSTDLGWEVTTNTIPKPHVGVPIPTSGDGTDVHYIYTCKKQ
ncbi:putative protein kinase domain protein [Blattamonas nauphoetae]|uniref:Methyltransferase type 11 domain-containing protein n=1 Tax=Blattamonas nauphoetae TaxID=2049346 RepID=A0ABQ9YCC3_9EUKA|nr:putative protein kinase domain protein [Blattamonas nauphoetae]